MPAAFQDTQTFAPGLPLGDEVSGISGGSMEA
jgi:hypothetical protein